MAKLKLKNIKQKSVKMKSNDIGKMAKIKVLQDLNRKGYTVFMDFTINEYGDFIIMPDRKIIKVKSAHYKKNGDLYHSRMSNHNYDILALVVGDEIIYKTKTGT